MGIGRATEGFSIFDIFAPTQERIRGRGRARVRVRLGTSERLRGRRNERSSTRFSSKSLPRTSFSLFNRIVIVLELVLDLCCCRAGNLQQVSAYGLKPWAELFCPFGAQTLYPSLMLTLTRWVAARRFFVLKWPTPSGRSAINLAICPRFRLAEYWRMSEIFRIC